MLTGNDMLDMLDKLAPGERRDLICPESDCDAKLRLKKSKAGLFYGCERWPACEGRHSANQEGNPLGTPANKETKRRRIDAHRVFDRIWRDKLRTRKEAYAWMQKVMRLKKSAAHISKFDATQCEKLISLVKREFPSQWDRIDQIL